MADGKDVRLQRLIEQWWEWSRTADRSEDGWEAGYPQWDDLMSTAKVLLTKPGLSQQEFEMVELCWRISEEDGVLAEASRADLDAAWKNLLRLSYSQYPAVRWQVYDVLGDSGPRAADRLREALDDSDSYCRRRAILSLSRLGVPDAVELSERFVNDSDSHIRQAAQLLRDSAR